MNVFLTSAYDTHLQLDALRELSVSDTYGEHQIVQSPDEADVILFVEDAQFNDYFYSRLRQHPWVKQYAEKVFMYNEVDYPWCALPGLYCSMPRADFQGSRQIAFPYLSNLNPHVPLIHAQNTPRHFLFSFVGSASHKSRREVLALRHTNAGAGIHDTSEFNAWKCPDKRHASPCRLYADTMAESLYVLCPRGLGTSSSRLFETVEAARAPVIVSDNWVAPPHIDWSFAVRIAESDIARIPEILASIKDEAIERGEAARAAWEKAYSASALFHTTISSIQQLQQIGKERNLLTLPTDQIYKTRVQLEHSVRSYARAIRNWRSELRFG